MIKKDTKVLIFGAGRSSVYFIKHLSEYVAQHQSSVTIIDKDFENLNNLDFNRSSVILKQNEISNTVYNQYIPLHDVVVSLLPASFHIDIAKACLKFKKNLLTASYVSPQMQDLDAEAKQKGLIFLNEMGLDPGLDHMSAMALMDDIKSSGGTITSYASHTGGLTEPTADVSDWNYKFTWNPKNVILAGQSGAIFLKNNETITIPYTDIFNTVIPVKINNNSYDSYPNRDSLSYKKRYHLTTIDSIYRGTLRHKGYCEAWQAFVTLGMTDDQTILEFPEKATHQHFLEYFLQKSMDNDISTIFCERLNITANSPIYIKFQGLDFFNHKKILPQLKGTAADLLLSILSSYWKLPNNCLDLVVMKHEIEYIKNSQRYKAESTLEILGENRVITAMSKTVGAPLLEGLKLLLNNSIQERGVIIPTTKNIYRKVLDNLEKHGIVFEEHIELNVCDS